MKIDTVKELLDVVRQGKYSSVGSYPLFYMTADGGVLSYDSVCQNIWQVARAIRNGDDRQWRVVAVDVNWEDPNLYCDDSGEAIEAAYV